MLTASLSCLSPPLWLSRQFWEVMGTAFCGDHSWAQPGTCSITVSRELTWCPDGSGVSALSSSPPMTVQGMIVPVFLCPKHECPLCEGLCLEHALLQACCLPVGWWTALAHVWVRSLFGPTPGCRKQLCLCKESPARLWLGYLLFLTGVFSFNEAFRRCGSVHSS